MAVATMAVVLLQQTLQPATVTVPAVLAAAQSVGLDIQHLMGCSSAGVIGSRVVLRLLIRVARQQLSTDRTRRHARRQRHAGRAARLPAADLSRGTAGPARKRRGPRDATHRVEAGRGPVGRGRKTEPTGSSDDDHAARTRRANRSRSLLDRTPLLVNAQSLLFRHRHSTTSSRDCKTTFPAARSPAALPAPSRRCRAPNCSAYSQSRGGQDVCFADGCVGVGLAGDIAMQSMTAQGAKPVGGIYQILKGQGSSIQIIVLDERATDALKEDDDERGRRRRRRGRGRRNTQNTARRQGRHGPVLRQGPDPQARPGRSQFPDAHPVGRRPGLYAAPAARRARAGRQRRADGGRTGAAGGRTGAPLSRSTPWRRRA